VKQIVAPISVPVTIIETVITQIVTSPKDVFCAIAVVAIRCAEF
jgi:hypothetical protein